MSRNVNIWLVCWFTVCAPKSSGCALKIFSWGQLCSLWKKLVWSPGWNIPLNLILAVLCHHQLRCYYLKVSTLLYATDHVCLIATWYVLLVFYYWCIIVLLVELKTRYIVYMREVTYVFCCHCRLDSRALVYFKWVLVVLCLLLVY